MSQLPAVSMTNTQSLAIGVTILDRRGNTLTKLPAGASIDFVSSDPKIVSVAKRADGMNADLGSENVGTATITVTPSGLTKADGSPFESDTVEITVTDAAPNSLNTTVGEPTDE
jgi:hypothetical protein